MSTKGEIERHARMLDDVGASMSKAGIGLHSGSGHVAVLKRMADTMRSDAAFGRTPYSYENGSIYASADTGDDAAYADLPYEIKDILKRTGIPLDPDGCLSLERVTAARAETSPKDRISLKGYFARIHRLAA